MYLLEKNNLKYIEAVAREGFLGFKRPTSQKKKKFIIIISVFVECFFLHFFGFVNQKTYIRPLPGLKIVC